LPLAPIEEGEIANFALFVEMKRRARSLELVERLLDLLLGDLAVAENLRLEECRVGVQSAVIVGVREATDVEKHRSLGDASEVRVIP
jgi:hypothetical protein